MSATSSSRRTRSRRFADAVVAWPRDGVPARPGAWLTVAARRRAIDRVRSERARTAREMITFEEDEESAVVDDRLRLIFTCCHPALAPSARVALTLRALGGLTTGEIARAFLVAEPTMGKRIVRAKRKIAEAHIPYRVPADEDLPDRVRGVLRVLYLIFNEGYAASEGDALVRGELCAEAIRLGRLLVALMPDEAEAWGLLALMLLHDARRAARVDADGRYVALDDQDRTLWDAARIEDGLVALNRALRLRRPGEYQLQAAISAAHLEDPVDWDQSRRAVRRAAVLTGGGGQPRGRRRLRPRPAGGPGPARAAAERAGAGALPAAARRPRRAAAPGRGARRRGGGVRRAIELQHERGRA